MRIYEPRRNALVPHVDLALRRGAPQLSDRGYALSLDGHIRVVGSTAGSVKNTAAVKSRS